jgi:hypothetical protein
MLYAVCACKLPQPPNPNPHPCSPKIADNAFGFGVWAEAPVALYIGTLHAELGPCPMRTVAHVRMCMQGPCGQELEGRNLGGWLPLLLLLALGTVAGDMPRAASQLQLQASFSFKPVSA